MFTKICSIKKIPKIRFDVIDRNQSCRYKIVCRINSIWKTNPTINNFDQYREKADLNHCLLKKFLMRKNIRNGK